MSDGPMNVRSWVALIISVALFFAGVTFGIMGRANRDTVLNVVEKVQDNSIRVRTVETKVEVLAAQQQLQYTQLIKDISEIKSLLKEHNK